MMHDNNTESRLLQVCQQLTGDSASALRAQRVSHRLARLAETPPILTVEQAELYDLNRLVGSVVQEALPLCQAMGARVLLQQDPRVPAVSMLLGPIEDALAAALDLCLQTEPPAVLRVSTRVVRHRAVVVMERRWTAAPAASSGWRTIPMAQVELLVGDRATRALGGRLRLQRREGDIRLWLELPISERPCESWFEGPGQRRRPGLEHRYQFPSPAPLTVIGPPAN